MTNTASIRIDLGSDTATRPSEAMRAAMAKARVGDEQRGEDPTVNELCERVAELTGKERGVFLPSGTMCNQISILTHCRPGDEILAAVDSHIIDSEGAGASALAGAAIRPLAAEFGIFDAEAVHREANRRRTQRTPRTTLVSVEQTHNRGGGRIWPLDRLRAVSAAAREHGYAMHMDGARLMNAAVASGHAARDFADTCDSVWIDLSKGLGCPIGGVLAGASAFIETAWIAKHRLGGAMRQAGIVAAAGLYALDHNVGRLSEDHDNAHLLGELLSRLPGVRLEPEDVHTNLVFFDISGTGVLATDVSHRLLERGIRVGVEASHKFRAVTHLDVTRQDVEEAAEAIGAILTELA